MDANQTKRIEEIRQRAKSVLEYKAVLPTAYQVVESIPYLLDLIQDKDAEIERLRAALEFYATDDNWDSGPDMENATIMDNDLGDTARATLKSPEPGSYKSARGILPWKEGDEPAEETISKLRGGER